MSTNTRAPGSATSPRANDARLATVGYHDDFQRINTAAQANGPAVLEWLLPGGKTIGGEYHARNPTRDDQHAGNFSINVATGRFHDFATGDGGGDYIALLAFVRGSSQGQAANELAAWLGIPGLASTTSPAPRNKPAPPPPAPAPIERPITPIPEEALASKPTLMAGRFPPSATWQYRDAEGKLLCEVWRRDPPNGERKIYHTYSYWTDGGWRPKALPEPRPLYHLDQLARHSAAFVLFAEGEKAADAARRLLPDFVATTTLNGAQSPGKSDFSPMRDRAVYIWPDHDAAGFTYGGKIAELCHRAGAQSIHILNLDRLAVDPDTGAPRLDGLKKGWDAADAESEGWTANGIAHHLEWVEWTRADTPPHLLKDDAAEASPPELAPDPEAPPAESSPPDFEDPEDDAQEDTPSTGGKKGKPSQADILLKLAERYQYFHDADGNGYARVFDKGKRVYAVRSKGFRDILRRDYLARTGRGIGNQALSDVIETLDAKAQFWNEEAHVYKRAARVGNTLFIDLADAANQYLVIEPGRWTITHNPPIDFIRGRNMTALPIPARKGNLQRLRPFLNVNDQGFVLCIAWILGALRGRGSYAIISLLGQAGSGKTTVTTILRIFTDPSSVPLRAIPNTELDLISIAANNHIIAFDNLSRLDSDPSDWLCKLSTGHGFGKRANYTDFEEIAVQTCNPVIVNGISPALSRGDFVSRLVSVELEPLPDNEENQEAEFWASLEDAAPEIFGGIVDALSVALRNEATTTLGHRVRLGDFARWVVAAEPALPWKPGAFLSALGQSQREAYQQALDASPVGSAVYHFMNPETATREKWTGTSTSLLFELTQAVGDKAKDRRAWPQTAESLAKSLAKLAPALREAGIVVERVRTSSSRWIQLLNTKAQASNPEPAADCPF